MPTITLNKKDLLKLVGKPLSNAQIEDRIAMLGTDVEFIKDNEIIVTTFPNRPDLLSEEGFARALSSFIGKKTGLRNYKVHSSKYTYRIDPKVKKIRPFVGAAVVKRVQFDQAFYEAFMNLQEKLCLTHGRNRKKVAIGAHDLDTIHFPLNYGAKDLEHSFTPLDMGREMTLRQILNKHPKGKEYGHLLEGQNHAPIWIDKKGQVLSMPPIINSEETKITMQTKSIFFDVTGTDQQAVDQALNILVTACADRGGKIYAVNKQPNLTPIKLQVKLNYVNQLLGLELKQKDYENLLAKMGLGYQQGKVLVPTYRVDILHPIDIIEDVAIAYGYENFKPELPNVSTVGEEHSFEKFKRVVSTAMANYGLLETNTHHLSNLIEQKTNMQTQLTPIPLTNALNEDYSYLRIWMLPSLLQVLRDNKHQEYPQQLYEIGTVFTEQEEFQRLACVLSGDVSYTDARQILEGLLRNLGVEAKYKETTHGSFIPGRVARVSIKRKKVAYVGELHPQVLHSNNLDMPVSCFELNLSVLYELLKH